MLASPGALRSLSLRSFLRSVSKKGFTSEGVSYQRSAYTTCSHTSTAVGSNAIGPSPSCRLITPVRGARGSPSRLLLEPHHTSITHSLVCSPHSHVMRSTSALRWRLSLCTSAATSSTCSSGLSLGFRRSTAGHLHWQAQRQATLRQRQQSCRYLAVRCCSSSTNNTSTSNGSQSFRADRREGTSERPMSSLF